MGFFDMIFDLFRSKKDDTDLCVACESTDLNVQAPGVYRCRMCGYEGGDNRREFQRLEKFEQLRRLSDDERRSRAADLMEQARLGMIAARGDVQAARDAIPTILRERDHDQQEERAGSLSLIGLTSTLAVVSNLEDVLVLTGSMDDLDHIHTQFQGGDWRADIHTAERVLEDLEPLFNELKTRVRS